MAMGALPCRDCDCLGMSLLRTSCANEVWGDGMRFPCRSRQNLQAGRAKAAMLLGASGRHWHAGPFPHAQMKAGEDAVVSEAWDREASMTPLAVSSVSSVSVVLFCMSLSSRCLDSARYTIRYGRRSINKGNSPLATAAFAAVSYKSY